MSLVTVFCKPSKSNLLTLLTVMIKLHNKYFTINKIHIFALPAWVCCEDRKWHPLSELLCDVICQGRPEGNTLIPICMLKKTLHCNTAIMLENMSQNIYLGRMVPGPGSSGPGTNTKRLLQVWDEQIYVKHTETLIVKHQNMKQQQLCEVVPAVNSGICPYGVCECFQ